MNPGASTGRERLAAVRALEARDEPNQDGDRDHSDEHAHARRAIAEERLGEDANRNPARGKDQQRCEPAKPEATEVLPRSAMFVRHANTPQNDEGPASARPSSFSLSCAGAICALNTRVSLGFERRIAA